MMIFCVPISVIKPYKKHMAPSIHFCSCPHKSVSNFHKQCLLKASTKMAAHYYTTRKTDDTNSLKWGPQTQRNKKIHWSITVPSKVHMLLKKTCLKCYLKIKSNFLFLLNNYLECVNSWNLMPVDHHDTHRHTRQFYKLLFLNLRFFHVWKWSLQQLNNLELLALR